MATPETDWIDKLNPDELQALTTPETVKEVQRIFSLQKSGLVTNAEGPPPSALEVVGREFFRCLCTNDARYRSVRQSSAKGASSVGIATALATVIGETIGKPVTIPVMAAMLHFAISVGTNSVCVILERRYGSK
jgi:hypothetical protein